MNQKSQSGPKGVSGRKQRKDRGGDLTRLGSANGHTRWSFTTSPQDYGRFAVLLVRDDLLVVS